MPFLFWGQRSRSQCIDSGKCYFAHNCLPFKKLSSWSFTWRLFFWVEDVPYLYLGQKVKGQGHNTSIPENHFLHIIAFPLQLSSWNFTQRFPLSKGCALFTSCQKVKDQGHNALIPDNHFLCIIAFPLHLKIMKLYTQTSHELRMCPIDVIVKGQGHNALITENGFWCRTAFPLHLQSLNNRLPVSPGYALMIME